MKRASTLCRLSVAAVMATALLSGCAPNDDTGKADPSSQSTEWPPPKADRSKQENAEFSTRQLETLEREMPDLARSMGAKTLETLREETCQPTTPYEKRPLLTRVQGVVTVDVRDKEVARKVGASLRAQAEKQGWNTLPEEQWGSGAGEGFYHGTHPEQELTLMLIYKDSGNNPRLTLYADGPCLKMPEGHKMTVSRLDPTAHAFVEEGGITHAVPDAQPGRAPLPESTQTPAPTGPEGVTGREPFDPSAPTPSPTSTKGFLEDAVKRP